MIYVNKILIVIVIILYSLLIFVVTTLFHSAQYKLLNHRRSRAATIRYEYYILTTNV